METVNSLDFSSFVRTLQHDDIRYLIAGATGLCFGAVALLHGSVTPLYWLISFIVGIGAASWLLQTHLHDSDADTQRARRVVKQPSFRHSRSSFVAASRHRSSEDSWSAAAATHSNASSSNGVDTDLPWLNLTVPAALNEQIERLCDRILQRFVDDAWYASLRCHQGGFAKELQSYMRFGASVLFRRVKRVNFERLISERIVPLVLNHLSLYLRVRKLHEQLEEKNRQKRISDNSNAGACDQCDIGSLMEKHLAGEVHVCIRGGRDELMYYSSLADAIIPHIIPPKSANPSARCLLKQILALFVIRPAIHSMSSPALVNKLITSAVGPSSATTPDEVGEATRLASLLLSNYRRKEFDGNGQMQTLLKDDKLVALLRRYLTRLGRVHLLDFLIRVQFVDKSLKASLKASEGSGAAAAQLSTATTRSLHSEVTQLYREFCASEHVCQRQFIPIADLQFHQDLAWLLAQDVSQVYRLQEMPSWQHAQVFVSNILENDYLPAFYESRVYYEDRLGKRMPATSLPRGESLRPSPRLPAPNEGMGETPDGASLTTSIGSVFSGLLRGIGSAASVAGTPGVKVSPSVETDDVSFSSSSIDVYDSVSIASGDLLTSSTLDIERRSIGSANSASQFSLDHFAQGGTQHDIRQFDVTIPTIETHQEPSNGSLFHLYIIKVTRLPVSTIVFEGGENEVLPTNDSGVSTPQSHCVERKYQEFYVLQSKLREFHGPDVLSKVQLPARRLLGTSTYEFMRARQQEMQGFLRCLCQLPEVRHSELVYSFLMSPKEFTSSSIIPDAFKLPSRLARAVPRILRGEKGQHLGTFIRGLASAASSVTPTATSPIDTPLSGGHGSIRSFNSAGSDDNSSVANSVELAHDVVRMMDDVARKSSDGAASVEHSRGASANEYDDTVVGAARSEVAREYFHSLGDRVAFTERVNYFSSLLSPITGRLVDPTVILFALLELLRPLPLAIVDLFYAARPLWHTSFTSLYNRVMTECVDSVAASDTAVSALQLIVDRVLSGDVTADGEAADNDDRDAVVRRLLIESSIRLRHGVGGENSALSALIERLAGSKSVEATVELLVDILQYETLNKQFACSLVDVVVAELFPELASESEASSSSAAAATSAMRSSPSVRPPSILLSDVAL